MRLAYPALSEALLIDECYIPCLVIENKRFFRTLLCDAASAIDGNRTDLVLSDGDRILDMAKNAEILSDFICFDLNRKTLLNKIIGELEKIAVSHGMITLAEDGAAKVAAGVTTQEELNRSTAEL